MKQYEAVILALEQLGGIATLGDLYQEVFKIKNCKWNTKTPFASIRRIVQERPEIYKIRPGLWALSSHRKALESKGIIVETDKTLHSSEVQQFNHSYFQGLLLEIGNLRGFETYVPSQDKNKKFLNSPLSSHNSLKSIMPSFSYSKFVQRASTIDVIWFASNSLGENLLMPHSFFEVEHTTDIQNSLLKFNDLRDFNTKMFIVADSRRKEDYNSKIRYSSFERLRKGQRVKFLSYENIGKLYEHAVQANDLITDIF